MSTIGVVKREVEKVLQQIRDEYPEEEAKSKTEPVETALLELDIPEPTCLDLIRANLHTTVQKDAFIAGVEWARKQLSL